MTWDDLAAVLTDVLGRLPEDTLLKLHEVSRPSGGYFAQLWQRPDRLYAEISSNDVLDPDRRLSPEQEDRLRELGWSPPGEDHPWHWWMELDWPAPAARYAALATGLVAAMRDVFGLRAPRDLAYQAERRVDRAVGWVALPELGIDPIHIVHYARVGPGDTPERPKGLLRRTRVGAVDRDEALGRDGQWRPTETLELADLGELDDDLVPLSPGAADRVQQWWRRLVEASAPAPGARPPDGPRLRLAAAVDAERDATGRATLPGPRLHDQERSAMAAYLRDAPLVAVAYGFDPDPFDPDQAEVVPLHVHTDGSWVWSESLAYFADRYGIAPEPELLRHMAQRQYQLPDVDDELLTRAVDLIKGQRGA